MNAGDDNHSFTTLMMGIELKCNGKENVSWIRGVRIRLHGQNERNGNLIIFA